MRLLLPLLVLGCLLAGAIRRVAIYDAFLAGAREGLETAWRIVPALIAMLTAIRAFAACGLLERLCGLLEPVFSPFGIPAETLPLMLMRPLSGSGSLAILKTILESFGPDSRIGRVACVLMCSSETVFYTCGLYLSAAGVKQSRHVFPCALLAWLAGSLAAGLIVS